VKRAQGIEREQNELTNEAFWDVVLAIYLKGDLYTPETIYQTTLALWNQQKI
jgi:hypothetical protein